MSEIRLVIFGAPRTKKTSNQLARAGMRHVVLPSAAWRRWAHTAPVKRPSGVAFPLPCQPYNCAAVFYRDANRGDAVGYYQGLGDLLESRDIIRNDKYIAQWDGSRLMVDRENPRVELVLTPVAAPVHATVENGRGR